MASTIEDFFHNAGRRTREVIQGGKDFVKGLRGQAQVAAEPAAPEPRPLTGAARSSAHGVEYTRNMGPQALVESPANARSWGAATNAAVDAELGMRQPAQPASRTPRPLSPAAQAAAAQAMPGQPQVGQVAPKAAPKAPPGGFGRLVRGLGATGVVLSAADAAMKAGDGRTVEQVTGTGGALQGGVTEAYDTATFGQGRRVAHGFKRAMGAFPALRSDDPRDQPSQYPSGLRGIASRFSAGYNEGAELEARAAGVRQPGQPPAARRPSEVMEGRSSMDHGDTLNGQRLPSNPQVGGKDDGLIPTTQGLRVSAEQLVGGRDVPAAGYGAFRMSGGQGSGAATRLGDGTVDQPQAAGLRASAAPAGGGTLGEQMGNMIAARTRLGAAVNEQEQGNKNADRVVKVRGQDVTAAGHALNYRTALAKLQYDAGVQNRKNVDDAIAAHAEATAPTTESGLLGDSAIDPKVREAGVKTRAADLKDRINFSLADRKDGKTIEGLAGTELHHLLLLDKMRTKVEDKRSTIGQSLRDFFGTKRFDSRNLYNYQPTRAEGVPGGGYLIHFAGGNTAKADLVGGDFRWLSPNAPVDADLEALVASKIAEAQKRGK